MASYSSIALTPTGDLDLDGEGFVSGDAAIAAEVIARINCERGTYFADLSAGVDPALVSGRLGYLGLAGNEFERVALGVPGVRSARAVETSYDPYTRTRSIELRLTTDVSALTLDLSSLLAGTA